jgi:hypothetical protein
MKSLRGYLSPAPSAENDHSSLTSDMMTESDWDRYYAWEADAKAANGIDIFPQRDHPKLEIEYEDDAAIAELEEMLTRDTRDMDKILASLELSPELMAIRDGKAKANALAEAIAHGDNRPSEEASEAEFEEWEAEALIHRRKVLEIQLPYRKAKRNFGCLEKSYKKLRDEKQAQSDTSE